MKKVVQGNCVNLTRVYIRNGLWRNSFPFFPSTSGSARGRAKRKVPHMQHTHTHTKKTHTKQGSRRRRGLLETLCFCRDACMKQHFSVNLEASTGAAFKEYEEPEGPKYKLVDTRLPTPQPPPPVFSSCVIIHGSC